MKTYLYRKHLRAPFSFLMIYVGAIYMGIALMVFGFFLSDEEELDVTLFAVICIILLITLIIITIEMVIVYFLVLSRFQAISVTLTEESIIYTNAKSRKVIPYGDIEGLRFPSIRYTGGWVKIKYQGGTIRLTVALEEVGDFITKLKEKLDELGRSQVYHEEKLFSFYKTAVFSDESWDRVYRNYKTYILINFLSIIINTLIIRLGSFNGNKKALVYGSIIAPLIGFVSSEIMIGIQVKKRVNRENLTLLPRDLSFEHKIYNILVLICSCAYPIILALFGLL